MESFWARAYGCQAEDGYELLRAFLQERREISGVEAAGFLGCDLEVIQPLLQRLVEDGLAVAPEPDSTGIYRWHRSSSGDRMR